MLKEARVVVDSHVTSTQRSSDDARQRLMGEAHQKPSGKNKKERVLASLRAAVKARLV